MNTHVFPTPPGSDPRFRTERRINRVGWGMLCILIGTLSLFPGERVPAGTWLASVGFLLLALDAWRWYAGIVPQAWSSILGGFALLAGLGLLAGTDIPVIAIVLIAAGVAILAAPLLRRHR